MYCPECGKQNNDSAKFCYNCGMNLTQIYGDKEKQNYDIEVSEYDKNLRQEYIDTIWDEVLESYFAGEEKDEKDFYEKAVYYSMSNSDVDKSVAEVRALILKANNFINHFFKDALKFELADTEIDEVCNYCDNLGFEAEEAAHLIHKYYVDHKIYEKREIVDELINEYTEKGKLPETDLQELSELSEEEKRLLTSELIKRIQEIEQELEAEYSHCEDFQLNKEARKKIKKIGKSKGFSGAQTKEIIAGYENRSGILDKRKQLEEEREKEFLIERRKYITDRIRKKYPENKYTLLGETVVFEEKYYLKYFIELPLYDIAEAVGEEYKKINKRDKEAYKNIYTLISAFDLSFCEDLSKIEKMFGLPRCEKTHAMLDNYLEWWKVQISQAMDAARISEQQRRLEQEYRDARKEMRGRWQGGGFGVGGAIRGAITAGAMNAVSGMAHSAVNAVGNARSEMAFNKRNQKIAESFGDVPTIMNEIVSSACQEVLDAIEYRYPDLIWERDTEEEQNTREKMLSGDIETRRMEAVKLLKLNPYSAGTYISILTAFGETDVYESLSRIAKVFDVELKDQLIALLKIDMSDAATIADSYKEICVIKKAIVKTDEERDKFNLSILEKIRENISITNASLYLQVIYDIRNESSEDEEKKRNFSRELYEGIFLAVTAGNYKNYEDKIYLLRDYVSQHSYDVDIFDQEFLRAFTKDLITVESNDLMKAVDWLVQYGQRYPDTDIQGIYSIISRVRMKFAETGYGEIPELGKRIEQLNIESSAVLGMTSDAVGEADEESKEAAETKQYEITKKSERGIDQNPIWTIRKSRSLANCISAGNRHVVGLRIDGTVMAEYIHSDNYKGVCNVSQWRDIVAVSAGECNTIGLKANGTVVGTEVALLHNTGQNNIKDWTDIVAISAGWDHTVGLKSNGTVVAVGTNDNGQCDVKNWKDIVAISAGRNYTVGLRADGTVIPTRIKNIKTYEGQCNVGKWKNIIAISAGFKVTVGLMSDGTVVAVGDNKNGACNVTDWTDIVAVASTIVGTVGLKADGTIVATSNKNIFDTEKWKDIVAISPNGGQVVGLKSDGTILVSTFSDEENKLIGPWKSDGAVLAIDGDKALITKPEWRLFKNVDTLETERTEARVRWEAEKSERKVILEKEKASLNKELKELKGIFSFVRRVEIESRLKEIDDELHMLA